MGSITPAAVNIYPDPTNGAVYCNFGVKINLAGHILQRTYFTTNKYYLPDSWANGIYIMEVRTTDKKVFVSKIILKR
ncbi:T9SS type A sorting domain-containing protein [Chitinophaga nivalis]|uniref:T9SS type A sorting domain-containing protein n=1 Tax=Chitinophaga nivalis TaxID=2991709 RepID=A0ABT3IWD9_9BACT|nr:T9SS type A sorting domain-containing protein [Chitinophaga nivalis]MCW3488302.1 T9SS type A sorting domain-containing protein [Chitinophaga nivalis]